MLRRTSAATLVLLAALWTAATAGGASRMELALELANAGQRPDLLGDLSANCALFFAGGFVPQGRGRFVLAAVSGEAAGRLDPAAGRGEALVEGGQWRVQALPPGRAVVRFTDLGLRLDGPRLHVTARVSRRRSGPATGPRSRIGVVRGARFDGGPLTDRAGREVPSTFGLAVRGRFSLLEPMSRPLGRMRCPGAPSRRPRIRAGSSTGRLFAQLRPAVASGLAGEARIRVRTPEGIAVEPDDPTVPIVSGLPVPLTCELGELCVPSGGTYGLGGGFDLVAGSARASVTGIAVRSAGGSGPDPGHVVTGVLNGTPVELASGPIAANNPWTADFRRRVGEALGVPDPGSGFLGVAPSFTRTGP